MEKKGSEKISGENPALICGSYLGQDFGFRLYDAAVSFETLHHLSHAGKRSICSAVREAWQEGGVCLERDFAAASPEEEKSLYAENNRLRREQNIRKGELCSFDTPCTSENEIALLKEAGFRSAEKILAAGQYRADCRRKITGTV